MKYNVYGHIISTGTKTLDTLDATSTMQAIHKAYSLHGQYYTMDKVRNEDNTLLMADDRMIYNK